MRAIGTVLVFACGVSIIGSAQTSLKTFTSPEGVFRFQYSPLLVNCMPEQTHATSTTSDTSKEKQPTGLSIPDSCMSQGETCDGPGSEGTPVACFAYPNGRFKNRPPIVGATFYVSEIKSAKTEKGCLEGSPGWFVISTKPGTISINDIVFKTFEIADNWTSGGQSGPAYRTFHNGECYELGIQTVTSRAAYDPGMVKAFTKRDWSEVEGRLRQALNSFAFLK